MALPVLHGQRLTLRPLVRADLDGTAAIVAEEGVREWWGPQEDSDRIREGLWNGGAAFAIEVDGALAGWLGVDEEDDPDYRNVAFDIALAAPYRHRGLGPEALRLAIGWLVSARGHHRFTIDPAVGNDPAIHAYGKVGFRRVGVLRCCERRADAEWHDNLLMELLAEDLPES